MRMVSEIDAGGLFVGDAVIEDGERLPENCVDSRPPEGLHSPRWDGSGWAEAMPPAELLEGLKAAKRAELARAFVGANTSLYPETEAAFSIWLAVPEYAANPDGERPRAVRANAARLRERLAAAEGASTVAAVGAVSW